MTTKRILVANLRREMLFFDDEACSRHQFEVKTLNFDDETQSRRQFGERNAVFWRRGLFSSPF
ncbi:hypothetical protein LIZ76_14550 [Caldibacillus sp. 210928-DFI.2.22]|uniref:hypothetical protein n=1 Tax=Caldibacillus sp. 210928-DFI.2.18 TaxID=2883264 RepID=UPI001D0666B3|nr:hypothetical protein [Caldibacillus sp. 210928-DFI.2.18]MCB7071158.1 hypothetical protein [Caldibacillus sp. 210928-DFI.2.22]MCB7074645.1 hypothetical protein [Caldibacillus sp. 210928-DFI.2.18]